MYLNYIILLYYNTWTLEKPNTKFFIRILYKIFFFVLITDRQNLNITFIKMPFL